MVIYKIVSFKSLMTSNFGIRKERTHSWEELDRSQAHLWLLSLSLSIIILFPHPLPQPQHF